MFEISETSSDPILTINSKEEQNAITFFSAGEEVLKVSKNGFWVNGHLVDDTDKGRKCVYESFKGWLVYQRLLQK